MFWDITLDLGISKYERILEQDHEVADCIVQEAWDPRSFGPSVAVFRSARRFLHLLKAAFCSCLVFLVCNTPVAEENPFATCH